MKIANLKLKIIFFGTPPLVSPIIKRLEANFNLVAVLRNPSELNVKTIQHLKKLNPDLFVVASFGKILSKEILEIPKFGAINIHPSLLPKYRGPSPIQTAILNGDKKTGVTFIKMDEKVDHGPIVEQLEEPILPDDTFETLSKRLFEKAADALVRVMTHRDAKETPQDDSKATYTKLLRREDGYIDFSSLESLEIRNWKLEIARRIRAYYPWPGVWTRYPLNPPPGQSPSGAAPKKTLIKLLPNGKIQVEGKRPMSYKDFINGYEKGQEFLRKIGLFG